MSPVQGDAGRLSSMRWQRMCRMQPPHSLSSLPGLGLLRGILSQSASFSLVAWSQWKSAYSYSTMFSKIRYTWAKLSLRMSSLTLRAIFLQSSDSISKCMLFLCSREQNLMNSLITSSLKYSLWFKILLARMGQMADRFSSVTFRIQLKENSKASPLATRRMRLILMQGMWKAVLRCSASLWMVLLSILDYISRLTASRKGSSLVISSTCGQSWLLRMQRHPLTVEQLYLPGCMGWVLDQSMWMSTLISLSWTSLSRCESQGRLKSWQMWKGGPFGGWEGVEQLLRSLQLQSLMRNSRMWQKRLCCGSLKEDSMWYRLRRGFRWMMFCRESRRRVRKKVSCWYLYRLYTFLREAGGSSLKAVSSKLPQKYVNYAYLTSISIYSMSVTKSKAARRLVMSCVKRRSEQKGTAKRLVMQGVYQYLTPISKVNQRTLYTCLRKCIIWYKGSCENYIMGKGAGDYE